MSGTGTICDGVHHMELRVYYEDTDAAGIVYYANYLRFAERARTEMLRCLGLDQAELRAHSGLGFVVKSCNIAYRRPAVLDDLLALSTRLRARTRTHLTMDQRVQRPRDGVTIADLEVQVVCVDLASGRPARLPAALDAVPMAEPQAPVTQRQRE